MSPEMLVLFTKVTSGQQASIDYTKECVTDAHDYYSLGVLLLELIDPEMIKYFKNQGQPQTGESYIQRVSQYFNERINDLYSCHKFQNSQLGHEFLSLLEGLLTPDPKQRLCKQVFQHPFIQKQIEIKEVWEAVAAGQNVNNLMGILQMEDNVYLKELRNQIDLVTDEQIEDEEEDDKEGLTEEE